MGDHSAKQILVEVAYATPEKQLIKVLSVSEGVTAQEAVLQSGIAEHFEDIDLTRAKLGVFGKVVSHDHILSASDRVEIYRPLIVDPKQVRKERAARVRKQRGGA